VTKGKFITLEGIDGAGKSTHLAWIAAFLEKRGHKVVITREPGGTGLGERLRELLLSQTMLAETEAMLMFAARFEHLHRVILPALEEGRWVVSDRFTDASFAYQGGGKKVKKSLLKTLEKWVQQGLQPDLTILFDLDPKTAGERCDSAPDKFEKEGKAFFRRVRQAYLKRASEYPHRIRIVDAKPSLQEIQVKLENILLLI
jgi:dTMP kinase